MKNKVQDGKLLYLTVGSTNVSGDPFVVGAGIHGVLQTSYDANGKAVIDTEGVFDLSVKGVNDDGNSAVAIGDRISYVAADTPKLSKKKSGIFFGIALEAVLTGATTTINVKLAEANGIDAQPYSVFAAGIYEIPASPAPDTTTEIPVTGILATDVCLVQQAVDSAASPSNEILTAIAQVSPAAILVTTSGVPTAADKFSYVVLRAAV
jgi:predicted RecA/RadA family phage recombinase